jgi:hypothetical protein
MSGVDIAILPYIFWSSCSLSILKPCGCNSCLMTPCESEIFSRRFVIFCYVDSVGSLPTFLYAGCFTIHGLIKGPLFLFLSYPVKRIFSFCALGWTFCLSFFHALRTGVCYCDFCPLWEFCSLIFHLTVLE